jgi:hypothetical protein
VLGEGQRILDDETRNLVEHHGTHRDFLAGAERHFLLHAEILVGNAVEIREIWHSAIIADCAPSVA